MRFLAAADELTGIKANGAAITAGCASSGAQGSLRIREAIAMAALSDAAPNVSTPLSADGPSKHLSSNTDPVAGAIGDGCRPARARGLERDNRANRLPLPVTEPSLAKVTGCAAGAKSASFADCFRRAHPEERVSAVRSR